MRGKLIVVEGTDCSGKATQSKILQERLAREGYKSFTMSFPRYDTPTGKIVGGPLLGKDYICPSFFEDASTVPPKIAGLYYVIDRLANAPEIEEHLEKGEIVILDRYVESNMAHQGGKESTSEGREKIFDFYETLEYGLLELPRPDGVIILHMPYEKAIQLRDKRDEKPDDAEKSAEYLRNSEATYLELVEKFGFSYVPCADGERIRTVDEIASDVYEAAMEIIMPPKKIDMNKLGDRLGE